MIFQALTFRQLNYCLTKIYKKKNYTPKKKKEEVAIRSSAAEYLNYIASVGLDEVSMEIRYEYENIWLTRKMVATLYDVSTSTINEHIMLQCMITL